MSTQRTMRTATPQSIAARMTFENYHDFMEFCNRLHANEAEPELMFQDYEHYPEQWYCEGCMGEATFDKIKEYAALGELQREAYEAYLTYWDDGTLDDFHERYEGSYESPESGCNAA